MLDALKLVKVFWPIFKLLLSNFAVLGVVGFIGLWVIFPHLRTFIPHWKSSPKTRTYFWGCLITILVAASSIYILANVK